MEKDRRDGGGRYETLCNVLILKRHVEKGMRGRQENAQQSAAKWRRSRPLKDTKS